MQTLTYGLFRPETGDKGSVWFPALEANFERLDAHNHDGDNSPQLTPVAFTKFTTAITSGQWTDNGGGHFSRLVTVPAGISGATSPFNDISYYNLHFLNSDGDRLYPTVERESSTTFTVRINAAIDLTIYYV